MIMDFRGKTPKKLGLDWSSDGEIAAISAKNIKHGQLVNLDKCHRGSAKLYNTWMKDGDLKKGDLLLTSEAPLGEWYQVRAGDKFILSQRTFALRPNPRLVDADYFASVIGSRRFQNVLHNFATGTTVMGIRQKTLLTVPIELPDIDTQRRIGQVISDLHTKFELNQQINKNLLKVCRLQFDKFKQVCSATTELSNIATLIMGQSPKGDTYNQNGEGTPLLNGAADFRGGINPSKYTSDPKKVTEPGDYVFGVRATIGLTTKVFNRYAIGRGTGLARARSYESDELLYFIMEDAFTYFARASTGSVYLNISRREFETYAAPDFSNVIIKQFHEFASPLMQQIYQNQEQNEELTHLRELLLPRLLAGDIDLSNIEAVMNNA